MVVQRDIESRRDGFCRMFFCGLNLSGPVLAPVSPDTQAVAV